jgi:hypothetical protein
MTTIHTPTAGEAAAAPAQLVATRPSDAREPIEVLFPEARQRERRRRLAILVVVIALFGSVGGALAVMSPSHHNSGPAAPAGKAAEVPPLPTGAIVALSEPTALAVSSSGTLYVVDGARDRVLERLKDGNFAVVAGDGKVGFAGDGGEAIKAELNDPTGLAVAANGALYIADRGNGRVREVGLTGTIQTVAGDGPGGWSKGITPALRTSLNAVSALAFGAGGKLYLGGDELSVLSPDGKVSWLAGAPGGGDCGRNGEAAGEAAFGNINAIALDALGDVFVANNGCHEIAELTTTGKRIDALNAGNGEGVTPIAGNALGGVFTGGERVWDLSAKSQVDGFDDSDAILGKGPAGNGQVFMVQHLAVEANGTIYADEDAPGTWSAVSAIAEIPLHGRAALLWKS